MCVSSSLSAKRISILRAISRLSLAFLGASLIVGFIINEKIDGHSINSPIISTLAIFMLVLFLLFFIGSLMVSIYSTYLIISKKIETDVVSPAWIWILPFLSAVIYFSFSKIKNN